LHNCYFVREGVADRGPSAGIPTKASDSPTYAGLDSGCSGLG